VPHLNHQRGETRRLVQEGTPCSCNMCGNPRRKGWDAPKTRAELKADLSEREQLGVPDRPRSRAKRKVARPWGIDVWTVYYGGGWSLHRKYATERARDEALAMLRGRAPLDYRASMTRGPR
jgi:hypothetical protein